MLSARLRKKTIRIVEAAVLIVSVSFFLAWGAAHGSTVSHFPEDFTESPASITTPLLSTISPDEDSQVQVELKRAENGFSHAISHILYSKSDLAECAVVQQSLNGDFDSKTGIAPSLFYYTTTRYTNLAQSSISNAYSKEWLRLHVENNSITTKGKIGECKYMYVSGETQYLIMWTERAILTVEYSGSGILTDFLSEYACALS